MACKTDPWTISSEERAKHNALFHQQKPVGGFLSANQAKQFFLQSGLPPQKLGHIWSLADRGADGRMDCKEFSIAMHLIRYSLHGGELPNVLPPSLLLDPSPTFSTTFPTTFSANPPPGSLPSFPFATSNMMTAVRSPMLIPMPQPMQSVGMMHGSLSATSLSLAMPLTPMLSAPLSATQSSTKLMTSTSGNDWAVPLTQRTKYGQIFKSSDKSRKLYLTGPEVKELMSQSNLQKATLAQIWSLSDIDGNGNLSLDEFCVAMHLVDMVKNGQMLPKVLPLDLIPPAYRAASQRPMMNSSLPSFSRTMSLSGGVTSPAKGNAFNDVLNFGHRKSPVIMLAETSEKVSASHESPKTVATFEDKRRENFEQGQAELKRRQAMLEEQKKKETEERLAFEKREQEKREQARMELEKKKQLEFEKQLAKQRKLEQEKEEQRLKELNQKEVARRELERQRHQEWEKQRRDQLMSDKLRQQTSVDKLQMEVGNLRHELKLLSNKRTELSDKIEQARQNIATYTSAIDGMKTKRDKTVSDIERFQLGIDEWTRKLAVAEQERISLEKKFREQFHHMMMQSTL